jgi:hypothetical protein
MVRAEPFQKWRVKTEITDRLTKRKKDERYHGSLTSYIEGILDRYADGLLTEQHEVKEVHAVRVRRQGTNEQRKAG